MLRVTLEMVPFGQEVKKRTIGIVEISNIKTVSDIAEYDVIMKGEEFVRYSVVKKFNRVFGAWELVLRAMKALKSNGHLINFQG
jgi:hypothetical protein